MKIDRDDLPPSVPAEIADRIFAAQEARDRPSRQVIVSGVALLIVLIFAIVAKDVLGWPYWVSGLILPLYAGIVTADRLFSARKFHRVLVDQGFTCPKCHGAMFTDTWSIKKQEAERNALFAERCPRCFEPVGQIVPGG